jgi:predicted TIM-barrel fold metal-dependent hydrolase
MSSVTMAKSQRTMVAEYGDRSGLDYNIIDSDAHMTEPPELWQRVDAKFRDRVPLVIYEHKGRKGMFLKFEDLVVRLAAPEELEGSVRHFSRPGGWDPVERLKDMGIDGVSAAVLYTTHGFFVFGTRDADLQRECFRVYNDWLAEFVSTCPRRLRGLGLISLFDVDHGVKELERCKKLGLSGALVWSSPPDDLPGYAGTNYDKFWKAAADLRMPIALHTNTRPQAGKAYSKSEENGGFAPYYTAMVMEQSFIQDSLLQLTFGGLFEKYPHLRIVSAEADISWVPALMGRADKYYEGRHRRGHTLPLERLPSEYMRENIWHSFIKDPVGLGTYNGAGLVDRVMWSTDYPHPASFFPDSLQVFKDDLSELPESDKRKIVHDNAAKLYEFDAI